MKSLNTPTIKTLATLLLITAVSACSDDDNEMDIPVSDVPANVISKVQNALPGISIVEAEKETKGELVIYELEGTLISGEEYDIKITAKGKILKIKLDD